jgi:uncharacterized protein (DUF427 family)
VLVNRELLGAPSSYAESRTFPNSRRIFAMTTKTRLEPSPDHPITIAPTGRHVAVRAGGQLIAETDQALTLQEADYQPVQYIPLEAVDAAVLRPTDHETYCPFKGEASYYTVTTPASDLENVIWTYNEPYDAVAEIAGHVAFYADRVELSVE